MKLITILIIALSISSCSNVIGKSPVIKGKLIHTHIGDNGYRAYTREYPNGKIVTRSFNRGY